MYKLSTKNGSYLFMNLEDVFNFIDQFEENVFSDSNVYVKLYFVSKEGNKK